MLISALETVVLPRDGFTRIARFVFAVADRILVHRWRNKAIARQISVPSTRPIALVSLPLVWMLSVTIGFSFIFWGIKTGTVQRSFEISGSSLFTLGFAEPEGTARIWLTFVEATIGLGLVALLISYLPTIYAAHHQREKGISVLRPFAGTPPSPVDLLGNLAPPRASWTIPTCGGRRPAGCSSSTRPIRAFPALCYFPESTPDQSWVASVGTRARCRRPAAVGLGLHADGRRRRRRPCKGPMLALAYGMPEPGRGSGMSAGLPVEPPVPLLGLLARAAESRRR